VIVADAEGRIIYVNAAAARMHGVAHLEVPLENYSATYNLYTEDDRPYPPHELPLARAVLAGESVEEARWRIRRPEGSDILAVGSARPLFGPDGRQTGAVLTLRDETARDSAERALRETEARFRAVFDQQFQFMAVLAPDGTTLEVNELPLRVANISRDQVIGRPFWETPFWADRPDLRRAWPDRLAAAAQAEGAVLSKDEFQTSSGEVRSADAAITAVRAPDGSPAFFVIQATDTTERRRADVATRESAAEFRAIFETAAAGVTEVDPRTRRYIRVNRRFCEIVGRSQAELTGGLGPDDISHADDRSVNAAALAAADDTGRAEVEKRYVRPEGTVIWVRASAAVAARDATGQAVRTVTVVQDITASKHAEHRQALLVAELNHRVKNLLTSVQAVAEQTLRGAAGSLEQFAESFSARLRALARAHDLLTERGWEPTGLGDVARAALSTWLPTEGGAARIRLDVREGARSTMISPRQAQALVLALHELTVNALKHGALSSPEGRVHVRCEAVDGALAVDWAEIGGPPVDARPARRGFGTRLLERALTQDLGPGSSVELQFAPGGLRASIRFPAKLPGADRAGEVDR
jgi:PAS domain S-box-containing protein